MSANHEDCDVVICGGGVGGLALAVALGRLGYRVIVLERRRTETRVHRGEFLQPHTIQIFHEWDTLPLLMERGALPIRGMDNLDANGTWLGTLNYELLPPPFNHGLVHDYHEIKRVLFDTATRTTDIRLGAQATELLRDGCGRTTGVRIATEGGEHSVRARLVVAADGMASRMREAAGMAGEPIAYGHQLMALDLQNVTSLEPRNLGFVTDDGVRVLYPMPGNRARLYVQIRQGEFKSIREMGMARWKDRLLGVAPGLRVVGDHFPRDLKHAQVLGAWRFCAPTWVAPGLALLGDAAHCVHPIAGQGMNTAIADAFELSRALARYAAGTMPSSDAVDRALEAYDTVRRPRFLHTARLCHYMSVYCTSQSSILRRAVQYIARSNRENRRLQYIVAYNVSGLGVRRFTWRDRLYQFGLRSDPNARHIGLG